MTTVDLLGLVLLGLAATLGIAVLAGGLIAFGEAREECEEGLEIEAEGLTRRGGLAGARAHTGDGARGLLLPSPRRRAVTEASEK
jgi:hypothetical protein